MACFSSGRRGAGLGGLTHARHTGLRAQLRDRPLGVARPAASSGPGGGGRVPCRCSVEVAPSLLLHDADGRACLAGVRDFLWRTGRGWRFGRLTHLTSVRIVNRTGWQRALMEGLGQSAGNGGSVNAAMRAAIPAVLCVALVAVLANDLRAQSYQSPNGKTRISFGPNPSPPNDQPDQFKSAPVAGQPGVENVWFCIDVCCIACNCPEGSKCGVQWNASVAVTGGSGTHNLGVPLQTECSSSCDSLLVLITGNQWGSPATSVSAQVSAWCICCVDGSPASSYGSHTYDEVELHPTATNPDPFP